MAAAMTENLSLFLRQVFVSLRSGIIAGIGFEFLFQLFLLFEGNTTVFVGLVLIFFWCIYTNYIYYTLSANKLLHDAVISFLFAMFFGLAAWVIPEMQGRALRGYPQFIVCFSLIINWITRFSIRKKSGES